MAWLSNMKTNYKYADFSFLWTFSIFHMWDLIILLLLFCFCLLVFFFNECIICIRYNCFFFFFLKISTQIWYKCTIDACDQASNTAWCVRLLLALNVTVWFVICDSEMGPFFSVYYFKHYPLESNMQKTSMLHTKNVLLSSLDEIDDANPQREREREAERLKV